MLHPSPSPPPRFEQPNNTQKGAHIIKDPIMQFSPVSC
jgi:hypothetical protein